MFRHRCLALLALLLAVPSLRAAEPPSEPMLRIEAGMHTAAFRGVGTDVAGRWVVTASDDKTARVWERATGRLMRILRPPLGPGHEGKLYAAALSPNGQMVAIGGWTGYDWDKQNSIYLFDRATGRLLQRLTGRSGIINHLAWSPDGRYLAACVVEGNGLLVWRSDTWALIGQDMDYGSDSASLAFSADGRFATSSYDGKVRLYRIDKGALTLLTSRAAPGGKRPLGIAFSPDGGRLALGYADSTRVDVLDSSNLSPLYQPDTQGVENGNLSSVAWSRDGQMLYAGGRFRRAGQHPIRRWPAGGRGGYTDSPVAASTILGLAQLPGGGVLYAGYDPSWGELKANGQILRRGLPPIARLDGAVENFRLSRDGRQVTFQFEWSGAPASFDLNAHRLNLQPDSSSLAPPLLESDGLKVSDWGMAYSPKLNGQAIPLQEYEMSESLALAPSRDHFVLGSNWWLRRFDKSSQMQWQKPAPGDTWQVNWSGDGTMIVAGYGDGTIRWHRASDGEELLALFAHADKKRWVLWTPSGYYDASPGAEELIGWHLNRGKDQVADFYPASRFRDKFYRPDVIDKLLESQDEAKAVKVANAASGRDIQPLAVAQILPPVVELLSPGADYSAKAAALKVRVRARSDVPLTGWRVRLDGQLLKNVKGLEEGDSANPNEREFQLTLPPHDSEINVFAENSHGISTPAVLRVSWAGATPAPVVAASTLTISSGDFATQPKLYVLAVGVSEYNNPAYRLNFAAKDASDFAAVLQQQQGKLYRQVEVKLLTDKHATRDAVLDGLEWLRRQVTAKDIGMLYLAGHGINDADGNYYYLPADTDVDHLKRSGVVFREIRDTLANLPGKALFFVDTCHSGNILGGRRGLTDLNGVINELASAENGVVVFSSSTGRQYSLEDASWGNGAFTKALVEGIGGKADFKHSGRITHKMLDLYVSERVKILTDGQQSPVTQAPGGVPDFPIALVK